MAPAAARLLTGGAAVAIVALGTVSVVRNDPGRLLETALCAGAVVVGAVLVRREPRSPVGPALAWTTGSLAFVGIHDLLPELPWSVGVWPVNLAGLFALLLVFPAGRRPGLTWRLAPWLFVIASACLVVSLWGAKVVDGAVTGSPGQAAPAVGVVGLVLVGVSMVIAVAHLVVSYRRGEQREREQIRWLMLAGIVVVVLLVGGWVAESFGAGVDVAYTPFVAAIATLVPAAVGVAIVRHDLFDVDRLLGESASWLVTLVLSAGVFGGVVLLVGQLVDEVTEVGSTAAAFVTALVLLPLQRNVHRRVSRVIDRDRFVAVALVDAFAADVRNGRREPEEIEAVLREAQGDPELVLLLAGPGGGWVRVDSTPATEQPGVTVESRGDPIARIVLRWDSSRARRRVRELSAAAWVPIEVTRLRLVLRDALEETRASRARLAEATAAERRRLERDLHDSAQQRLVATGMRLRLLQRRLEPAAAAEVDGAVAELQATVDELRRLAQGIRPHRLDDGLDVALAAVRAATPMPFDLEVGPLPSLDEQRTLTAYLVISEAVANTLKHADASRVQVRVTGTGDRLCIEVADDGVGGVGGGEALVALRDRVLSVGGTLEVDSPPGRGTRLTATV